MAEKALEKVEEFLLLANMLHESGLYDASEVKGLVKEREKLEYKLSKRISCKEDFLESIKAETNLLLELSRRAKCKKVTKSSTILSMQFERIHYLYEKYHKKFRSDLGAYEQHLYLCFRANEDAYFYQILSDLVKLHFTDDGCWLLVTKWTTIKGDAKQTVKLFQKALEVTPKSKEIWIQFIHYSLRNKKKGKKSNLLVKKLITSYIKNFNYDENFINLLIKEVSEDFPESFFLWVVAKLTKNGKLTSVINLTICKAYIDVFFSKKNTIEWLDVLDHLCFESLNYTHTHEAFECFVSAITDSFEKLEDSQLIIDRVKAKAAEHDLSLTSSVNTGLKLLKLYEDLGLMDDATSHVDELRKSHPTSKYVESAYITFHMKNSNCIEIIIKEVETAVNISIKDSWPILNNLLVKIMDSIEKSKICYIESVLNIVKRRWPTLINNSILLILENSTYVSDSLRSELRGIINNMINVPTASSDLAKSYFIFVKTPTSNEIQILRRIYSTIVSNQSSAQDWFSYITFEDSISNEENLSGCARTSDLYHYALKNLSPVEAQNLVHLYTIWRTSKNDPTSKIFYA